MSVWNSIQTETLSIEPTSYFWKLNFMPFGYISSAIISQNTRCEHEKHSRCLKKYQGGQWLSEKNNMIIDIKLVVPAMRKLF